MEDQDRGSQASSVASISPLPPYKRCNVEKVQTFGKRCRAARRDPNCPVVIRGWLNKKDSSGLKLWKRRWFVLSNYCLFYYKDSREESVLGSIPLPSYNILFCTPRECKNRKNTFKVVHQGMRSYFFSADTQEDMLGWVRALTQSAAMEIESSLKRRCSSYQDFTQMGGSSESVAEPCCLSEVDGMSHKPRWVSRTQSEPSHMTGGRMGRSMSEQRDRRSVCQSPSPDPSLSRGHCATMATQHPAAGSTYRALLGSRPHTPVGRVDIRPQTSPPMVSYTPPSPRLEFRGPHSVRERWNLTKPTPTYGSVHHGSSGRRSLGKSFSTGANCGSLPPLPPSARAAPLPHLHHRSHLTLSGPAVVQSVPAVAPQLELRDAVSLRPLESDSDAVLTRLCGCDKLLHSLSMELAQLQVDKDSIHVAMEMTRLQLEEWRSMAPQEQEDALTQKALLQEELVTIRARMCDVSLEMERVWSQYERMESQLSVIRSELQHFCNFGMPQEQSQAQREMWMMEDILSGLRINRDHFSILLGLHTQSIPPSLFQRSDFHPGSPTEELHSQLHAEAELDPPLRPPLPEELQEGIQHYRCSEPTYEGIYSNPVVLHRAENLKRDLLSDSSVEPPSGSRWTPPDVSLPSKKGRMSEDEQMERMRRNQQRLTNQRRAPMMPGTGGLPEAPFPLRVTRVVSALLPSSMLARKVSIEDPSPELSTRLPEQIPHPQPASDTTPPPVVLQGLPPKTETRTQRDLGTVLRSDEVQDGAGSSKAMTAEATPPLTSDPCLTSDQREAKLRRVQRIRERVIQSAVRKSALAPTHLPINMENQEVTLPVSTNDGAAQSVSSESNRPDACWSHSPRGGAEQGLWPPAGQAAGEHDGREPGNKSAHRDCGVRTGATKHWTRPPAAARHTSSVTLYQRSDGQLVETEEQHEYPPGRSREKSFLSTRAEWFLSTNRSQGFIPLQNNGMEPCCDQEVETINSQWRAQVSDGTNCDGILPAVNWNPEEMNQNHSLFYKIACDLSMSDTDLTGHDGDPNAQLEHRLEEWADTRPSPDDSAREVSTCGAEGPSQAPIHGFSPSGTSMGSNKSPEPPSGLPPSLIHQGTLGAASHNTELCVYEEMRDERKNLDNTEKGRAFGTGTRRSKAGDPGTGRSTAGDRGTGGSTAGDQGTGGSTAGDRETGGSTAGDGETGESTAGDRKTRGSTAVDRGTGGSTAGDPGPCDKGGAVRSSSFRTARVTVLRTSL